MKAASILALVMTVTAGVAPSGDASAISASQDGYLATLRLSTHAVGTIPADTILRGRAPSAAEKPPTPGADSVYFFTIESESRAVPFDAGSRLDVRCPFRLDSSLRYTLTIARSDPYVGPIVGTTSDHVLHFTLPAFTVPPGTEVQGEIDGYSP